MNLVDASGLAFAYGEKTLLNNVSLSLAPGELVGLVGPNGAGKTTLLRLLANLLEPASGEIFWENRPVGQLSPAERARFLAYLPQGAPAHWPLAVERVIELGRIPHRAWWQQLSPEDAQAVEQAMIDADVDALRGRVVTTLSGGERARVMLARIFATRPRVIVADEPVASLDPYHQLQVMQALRERAQLGDGVLVVLHDLDLAARYCDRLVLLHQGAVACEGSARDAIEHPALAAAYGVDIECVESGGELWVRYRQG